MLYASNVFPVWLSSLILPLQAQLERQESHQAEIESFTDKAQVLVQTSNDNRVNTFLTQITTRYNTLTTSSNELAAKWQKYVLEHELYNERQVEFTDWLQKAQARLKECRDTAGDRETLQNRKTELEVRHFSFLFVHTALFHSKVWWQDH